MRPWPDLPSPTIPASFQSNFIHPLCNRNYTAREGARLQSFPDRYVFCGKRTTMSWEKNLSQYQQIGNAVPPLLARALGERIKKYFLNIGSIKTIRTPILRQASLFWFNFLARMSGNRNHSDSDLIKYSAYSSLPRVLSCNRSCSAYHSLHEQTCYPYRKCAPA